MPLSHDPSVLIAIVACVVGTAGLRARRRRRAPSASSAPRPVTLVTGDVVSVSTQAGGRQAASVLRVNPDGRAASSNLQPGTRPVRGAQSAVPYLRLDDGSRAVRRDGIRRRRCTWTSSPRREPAGRPHRDLRSGRRSPTGAADHRVADPHHGLFANVARISASASSVVAHELRHAHADREGSRRDRRGDTGDDVLIYNVTTCASTTATPIWRQGVAKVSVRPVTTRDLVLLRLRGAMSPDVHAAQFSVTGAIRRSPWTPARRRPPVSVTTPHPGHAGVNEVGRSGARKGRRDRQLHVSSAAAPPVPRAADTKRITVGAGSLLPVHPFVRTVLQL